MDHFLYSLLLFMAIYHTIECGLYPKYSKMVKKLMYHSNNISR
jgi:hypothetical protein